MRERGLLSPATAKTDFPFSKPPTMEELVREFPEFSEREIGVQPWTISQIMNDFVTYLKELDGQIRYPRLTMNKKTISFINFDDTQPKTSEEKGRLANVYGDYIIGNVDGDCRQNSDGSHTIRIGFADQEDIKSKDQVLAVMSHEFGHTLGRRLKDPILEELKAKTFANLFMKHIGAVEPFNYSLLGKASDIHATAEVWLSYLLENGFNEVDVLAHLTGRRFGDSYPKNYIKFLTVISSNVSTELKLKSALAF